MSKADSGYFGGPADTAWRLSIGVPAYDGHTTVEWMQCWLTIKACLLMRSLWLAWCK